MNHIEVSQKNIQPIPTLDAGFEAKLLASKLVSEVRKSPGHFSFTMTDVGVIEFAKAMRLATLEDMSKNEEKPTSLFPDSNGAFITKKEAMLGFGVSHTTLWKWQKSGYLTPVKVGKRVYYRREDIQSLTQREVITTI